MRLVCPRGLPAPRSIHALGYDGAVRPPRAANVVALPTITLVDPLSMQLTEVGSLGRALVFALEDDVSTRDDGSRGAVRWRRPRAAETRDAGGEVAGQLSVSRELPSCSQRRPGLLEVGGLLTARRRRRDHGVLRHSVAW